MKTTGKVFMACGIGAFIGTLVALQLHRYLWWIGMLVGGLAGYLSFEFKKVCQAVPVAYRAACDWKMNSSGSPLFWKAVRLQALQIFLFAFWVMTAITTFISFFIWSTSNNTDWLEAIYYTLAADFILIIFGGTFVFAMTFNDNYRGWKQLDAIKKSIDENMGFLITWNPIRMAKIAVIFAVKMLWKGFLNIPALCIAIVHATVCAIVAVCKFLKHLFILIHSDMRMLCGLDAALGAAVGYYFSNAIIGALAGGVLGVFNYQVVSIKWLHLDNIKGT